MAPKIAALTAAVLVFGSIARAEDKVWSAVILATNAESPKAAPSQLREYEPRLKRVFGYNQFEIIGSATDKISDQASLRLSPTQSFSMAIKARRSTTKEARGGYLLSLQLLQGERQIVDTETRLAPGSPLFIRGPEYGKGQVVFALLIE